jgi:hypothetical protein
MQCQYEQLGISTNAGSTSLGKSLFDFFNSDSIAPMVEQRLQVTIISKTKWGWIEETRLGCPGSDLYDNIEFEVGPVVQGWLCLHQHQCMCERDTEMCTTV